MYDVQTPYAKITGLDKKFHSITSWVALVYYVAVAIYCWQSGERMAGYFTILVAVAVTALSFLQLFTQWDIDDCATKKDKEEKFSWYGICMMTLMPVILPGSITYKGVSGGHIAVVPGVIYAIGGFIVLFNSMLLLYQFIYYVKVGACRKKYGNGIYIAYLVYFATFDGFIHLGHGDSDAAKFVNVLTLIFAMWLLPNVLPALCIMFMPKDEQSERGRTYKHVKNLLKNRARKGAKNGN